MLRLTLLATGGTASPAQDTILPHKLRAACRRVGQVANLRGIVNPALAAITRTLPLAIFGFNISTRAAGM